MVQPINETPASILIIDDHPLLRRGVAQLLELEDDLALVGDIGEPEEGFAGQVVMFTVSDHEEDLVAALRGGARQAPAEEAQTALASRSGGVGRAGRHRALRVVITPVLCGYLQRLPGAVQAPLPS